MTFYPEHSLDPENAWALWNQLQDFANALWQTYEPQFLDFCGPEFSQPFDDEHDPSFLLDDEDDIPF